MIEALDLSRSLAEPTTLWVTLSVFAATYAANLFAIVRSSVNSRLHTITDSTDLFVSVLMATALAIVATACVMWLPLTLVSAVFLTGLFMYLSALLIARYFDIEP